MRWSWRPVACVVSACLALSASGCFSGQQYASEGGARIEPGMTMEEVLYRLGDPDVVVKGDAGTETEWTYRFQDGPGAVATVLLLIFAVVVVVALVALASKGGGGGSFGGTGGGGSGPVYQIKIRFDATGHVLGITPAHPVPDTPE